MSVRYEWDVEVVVTEESEAWEVGEILDHHFQESKRGAVAHAAETPEPGTKHVAVLVRDTDRNRSWAYMNADGTMPPNFLDAFGHPVCPVPARFR